MSKSISSRARPQFTPYEPSFSSPCPCGSGRKFHECCRSRLPGFGIDKDWRIAAEEGRWQAALLLVRADVAQYVIWHRRHTIPNLNIPGQPQHRMYEIDVAALSEHVGHLTQVLYNFGRLTQAPAVLERLRSAIADPRWDRKITYHRALTALVLGDRDKAREILKAAGPITATEEDVDLLQIEIDLNGAGLGFTERQALYVRILEVTRSRADKIQYRGCAAFDLLLLGDDQAGRAGFEAAIAEGRAMESEKPLSPRAESWFCRALETLAVLDRDPEKFKELTERLDRLLAGHTWTDAGRANLLRSLGDAHRFGGDYAKGVEAYRASYKLNPEEIVRVFEAECLLRQDLVADALALIRAVKLDSMSGAEVADHAFTYFYVALAAKDRQALLEAEQRLRTTSTPHPYFERERLKHLVEVHDALTALSEHREPAKVGPLLRALKAVSRYVQLQPNFSGVGINFNNMIDDAVDRAERKTEGGAGQ
jgi:tetratricopeptide (TPR) repeat protein